MSERERHSVDDERRRVLRTLVLGGLAATPLARAFGEGASGGSGGGGVPAPAAGAGSAAAGSGSGASPSVRAPVVARAHRAGVLSEGSAPDPRKLAAAVGSAVARAGGEDTPVAALRRLFRPNDVVGIKVNCIAGRGLAPHPDLVGRLTGWLQEAGVPARNIIIWDRTDRELAGAGYTVTRGGDGVRVIGTNDAYETTPREWGPTGSCFAKLLVEDLTALINVGVLKDHDLAGVSLGLKNWYGAINNPNKCHDDGAAPYIPHLAASPLIREKLRLTVIDGLRGQCHGGPGRSPRWSWPYEGVLASTDPVAIESVGYREIEDRRRAVGLKSLAEEKRAPRWIETAAKLGLGESDLRRIRLEDV